jgi:hypothetical protein
MQKEQKAILNELKETLKNQFQYIRYVRREKNSIKCFSGTWKSPIAPNDGVWGIATKQQQQRGWIPLGVEMDLTPYKQFVDRLQIPGLTTEIIITISSGVEIPELVATLAI